MTAILLIALIVTLALLLCTLVGASQQADDLKAEIDYRDARIEDLENEVRDLQRQRHPSMQVPRQVREYLTDTPTFELIATERHLAEVRRLPTRGGEGA